jgi:CRP-like cAMP-binding protein
VAIRDRSLGSALIDAVELSDSERVEGLMRRCPRLSVEQGGTLRPAEIADAALVVVDEGIVVLRKVDEDRGRGVVICHAGTAALLLPPDVDEVFQALSDVRLTAIPVEIRDELLEIPAAARVLLEGVAATLRQKLRSLAMMASLHHVDRVRAKLTELARDYGRVGPDGIRLDFPITHDLLGEMIGSSRETVTRSLDELQREGFVIRHGRSYLLHVPPQELRDAR